VRVVAEIARGLWESVREVLPESEADAGPFVSGFVLAFVLHWVTLLAVTYAHCAGRGGC
jgi:hypothetical protein